MPVAFLGFEHSPHRRKKHGTSHSGHRRGGPVGAVGRTVTELLLKQGEAVRAMVRNEDQRAQALRDLGAEVVLYERRPSAFALRCVVAIPRRLRELAELEKAR